MGKTFTKFVHFWYILKTKYINKKKKIMIKILLDQTRILYWTGIKSKLR